MPLLGLPVPPAVALAGAAREIGGAHGAARANMREQRVDCVAMLRVPFGRVFPAHADGVEHLVAHQAEVLDRQEARFMRPVLEQFRVGEMFVEPLRRICAEPAEQHEIRAARDDMDRVDLQLAHPADGGEHVGLDRLAARRRQEALRGEMQCAGRSDRERGGHERRGMDARNGCATVARIGMARRAPRSIAARASDNH